ncbi:PLDc N-terminal domain-containing protein [Candidatus Micrarchaeota archaeon]|nr:PLDc N-terminal domain-containing protein [Candidatus Micrarchaeota archaeon]
MASSSGVIEFFTAMHSMMCMFGVVVWAAIAVFTLLMLIVWVLMLVDCIKRKFTNENDRLLWILIVVLAGFIGATIYYFLVKRPDKH